MYSKCFTFLLNSQKKKKNCFHFKCPTVNSMFFCFFLTKPDIIFCDKSGNQHWLRLTEPRIFLIKEHLHNSVNKYIDTILSHANTLHSQYCHMPNFTQKKTFMLAYVLHVVYQKLSFYINRYVWEKTAETVTHGRVRFWQWTLGPSAECLW